MADVTIPPVSSVEDMTTALALLKRFQKALRKDLGSVELRKWVVESLGASDLTDAEDEE